ncbi:hypothetical protein [Embleya sp. NPDC005971]|uniref:hypothetical protein n=1 Tax=Embleya sp. NPDC005971 TaxID=3156724 RepID=UPI0033D2231D
MIDSTDPAETWTITQAAEHLGARSTNTARRFLARAGIHATGRQPGRSGENLYDAQAVRDAQAARPGRGARTDLHAPATDQETS